ncbi:MFS transporter [Clostridium sp. E02]|uniref:MFS transporter n=1 Tax=Clostridium sp. E02 TaxID=2487134 RepID=UPI000F53E11D|nr:MFS transporter [Clostridium sp. E02]
MVQLLIVIIYISFISLGLPDALLGSAWPVMYSEMNVPISYAGILSMIIAGCTIFSSLLSGRMVRKAGTGVVTVISVGMTAVALFGFSISPSFLFLCIWAIPYGLGAGAIDAALNNFVALHYKARHMNWLHCFWGLGATLGPYIMGASLTGNLGWQHGYRFISLIQILLTAILVLSLPLWKKQVDQTKEEQSEMPTFRIKEILRLPCAWQTLIAFFFYCSLEQVTGLWGSSYMVLKKGITPETAASLISLFYLGITGGRFLSGLLTININTKNLIRLGQGIAGFGVVLLFISQNTILISVGYLLIGLGCAPIFPSLLHQTPERFGKNASQSMMGVQMACAYVGSTFSPITIGFLTQKLGITWYPLFLLVFIGGMIYLIESCNYKQVRRTGD